MVSTIIQKLVQEQVLILQAPKQQLELEQQQELELEQQQELKLQQELEQEQKQEQELEQEQEQEHAIQNGSWKKDIVNNITTRPFYLLI